MPLNLDLEFFLEMWKMEMVKMFVAKDGEKLAGYYATMISASLLTLEKVSEELGLYVLPEYRGNGVMAKMLSYAERRLKDVGVVKSYISSKEKFPVDYSPLGYSKVETKYCMEL